MENQRYCQSCAMPMPTDDLLGTNQDGEKNGDYCVYCYKDGKLSADCTMEEMIEFCVPHVLEAGVYPDAKSAKASMMEFFPTLKRWKST